MSQEFKKYVFPHPELPAPIKQVKDNAANVFLKQLTEMFASCDDLFFDLSGRAVSNSEQNLYFESMREIRLKKAIVIAAFKRQYEKSFKQLPAINKPEVKTSTADSNIESLALIGNDQLEEKVAISGMTSKARAKCQEELYHLTYRLDYLIKHKQIDETNNPLEPELLCTTFCKAAELFELNIKARIILLKQFDRFVIANLADIYQQANLLLINAGVLPQIQGHLKKGKHKVSAPDSSPSQDSSSQNTASQNTASQGAASQVAGTQAQSSLQENANIVSGGQFGELQSLLSGLRNLGVQVPSVIAVMPNYNPSAPSFKRIELVDSLNVLQSAPEASNGELDIRKAINQILNNSSDAGAPRSIATVDEDIINLVAMFFDFVLDDENIPVAIQALISRLQIPVLKLALKDKNFLNNNAHPARLLINEMANSAIGWNDTEKHAQDKLYDQLSEIIHTILDNYSDNEHIFEQQLKLLTQQVHQDEKRSALIERRASEAAVGKAKTNHAKEQIVQLLSSRLANKKLPKEISLFLNFHWQKVLLFVLLRNGEDSPSWLESVQVIDDLIWSTTRHDDAKSQQRLSALLPKLKTALEHGLARVAISPSEVPDTLAPVLEIQRLVSHREFDRIEYVSTSENESNTQKSWDKMTAIERQQAKHQKLEYEYIKAVDRLPLGSWIEFAANDGEHSRGKLTAKVDESDSFIFLNRFGAKVTEKNRKEFAFELQKGTARILDKSPLFDRALSSLGNNLRALGRQGN
jgi:hypothetical protein